jgi:hypothetical protein
MTHLAQHLLQTYLTRPPIQVFLQSIPNPLQDLLSRARVPPRPNDACYAHQLIIELPAAVDVPRVAGDEDDFHEEGAGAGGGAVRLGDELGDGGLFPLCEGAGGVVESVERHGCYLGAEVGKYADGGGC